MTLREKIIEEINHVPEESLHDVYSYIQTIKTETHQKPLGNFMSKLREITIQAPPDFSVTAGIYHDIEDDHAG